MNKQEILLDLKSDYEEAKPLKEDNDAKVAKWLDIRDSKKYGNEKPNKSQYVSDITKKLLGWQIPAIVDPLVNNPNLLDFRPMTAKDKALTEQEQAIATYDLLQVNNHYEFITDLVTMISEQGTAFVKLGWEYREEEREFDVPKTAINPLTKQEEIIGIDTVKKKVVVANHPTHVICNLSDVVADPTCEGDLERANFIIHSYETDLSTLKSDDRFENIEELEAKLDELDYANQLGDDTNKSSDYMYASNFEFKDKARRKILVHEYWGKYDLNGDGIAEPIVAAWSNDVIIRMEENPLPDKKIPFVKAVYDRKPKAIYGEPLAAVTAKTQHIDSVLKRGVFDELRRANNGQLGVKKGALDNINKKKMEAGLDFEFNTSPTDIWMNRYQPMAQSIFKVLEDNSNEAEAITGVRAFSSGSGGNSLGSTAAAVNASMSSASKREMHIIRGIAETCIIPMVKKWLDYSREFRSPKEIQKITDKPYVPIVHGLRYDIDINIESAEVKQQKIQSMGFLLQTMGPNMPQEVQQLLLARYVKLNGELDLASMIETYQPQPDPMQVKMQELQMQLLAAQVQLEQARAEHYKADIPYKVAKAKDVKANADLKDLDYVNRATGIQHNQDLQKEVVRNNMDMNKNIVLEQQKAHNNAMNSTQNDTNSASSVL